MSESGSIFFLAIIPLMWCFVSWTLSRASGWNRLAQDYLARDRLTSGTSIGDSDGGSKTESAHMRSARIGGIHYHSMLSFRVSDTGLRISILFLFRLGHPPLFVPWDELYHVFVDPRLYSHKVKVSIGKPTVARAVLPGWVRYRMPIEMRP